MRQSGLWLVQHLKAEPEKRDEILERVSKIQTREDAHDYLVEVQRIVKPAAASAH